MDFATHMTEVWPTAWLQENPCEVKYGNCKIKESCDVLKKNFKEEEKEFSLSFNLVGTDDKEITITLPWEELLIEPKDSELTPAEEIDPNTKLCYLPIYAQSSTLGRGE